MNKARLLTLANFLKTVPDDKFDVSTWRKFTYNGFGDVTDKELQELDGTTGCAIGWACVIPEFKEAGLYFHRRSPIYDGHVSFAAISKFFDISSEMTQRLFGMQNKSKDCVIKDIMEEIGEEVVVVNVVQSEPVMESKDHIIAALKASIDEGNFTQAKKLLELL